MKIIAQNITTLHEAASTIESSKGKGRYYVLNKNSQFDIVRLNPIEEIFKRICSLFKIDIFKLRNKNARVISKNELKNSLLTRDLRANLNPSQTQPKTISSDVSTPPLVTDPKAPVNSQSSVTLSTPPAASAPANTQSQVRTSPPPSVTLSTPPAAPVPQDTTTNTPSLTTIQTSSGNASSQAPTVAPTSNDIERIVSYPATATTTSLAILQNGVNSIMDFLKNEETQNSYFSTGRKDGMCYLENRNNNEKILRYMVLTDEIAGFARADRGTDWYVYLKPEAFPEPLSRVVYNKEVLLAADTYMTTQKLPKLEDYPDPSKSKIDQVISALEREHWNRSYGTPPQAIILGGINHVSNLLRPQLDEMVNQGIIHSWNMTHQHPIIKILGNDPVSDDELKNIIGPWRGVGHINKEKEFHDSHQIVVSDADRKTLASYDLKALDELLKALNSRTEPGPYKWQPPKHAVAQFLKDKGYIFGFVQHPHSYSIIAFQDDNIASSS